MRWDYGFDAIAVHGGQTPDVTALGQNNAHVVHSELPTDASHPLIPPASPRRLTILPNQIDCRSIL